MTTELPSTLQLITGVAAFGLVLSLWIGGIALWQALSGSRRRHLQRRLGLRTDQPRGERTIQLWRDGEEVSTTVPVLAAPRSLLDRVDDAAVRAGLSMGGAGLLLVVSGLMLTTAFLLWVFAGSILVALAAAAGVLVITQIYIRGRIARQEALFERQLVDALELASRSLRAGHPLMGAFELVSEEMSPPVDAVFAEICQQHAMGAEIETALRAAAQRSSSSDLKLFSTSVAIQVRSGGNLANLMDRLAGVIRDRVRLGRRVRVLSAQTQMSKRVLIGLPVVVFFGFTLLNPDYMTPLYVTSAGRIMLASGVAMLALGAWIMNRMAILKY